MDDSGDSIDSLAAWFCGWSRKQHSSSAGDCAGRFGASVNNPTTDIGAMISHRDKVMRRQGDKETLRNMHFIPLVFLSPVPLWL